MSMNKLNGRCKNDILYLNVIKNSQEKDSILKLRDMAPIIKLHVNFVFLLLYNLIGQKYLIIKFILITRNIFFIGLLIFISLYLLYFYLSIFEGVVFAEKIAGMVV